jgi:uncharacterized protein YndB with AHSA1/START domain
MEKILTSKVQIEFETSAKQLWRVLTESKYTKVYMFNCSVESDWLEGSSITWQGNYQGYQAFQKGKVLTVKPYELIKYSTFDPNVGLSDVTENYINVTYAIKEHNGKTTLTITNDTFDGNEERMKHIINGWEIVKEQMIKLVNTF